MVLCNYEEAVHTARTLIEPPLPLSPDEGTMEYVRGIVELIAYLYPITEYDVRMAEYKQTIAVDIGLDPALTKKVFASYDDSHVQEALALADEGAESTRMYPTLSLEQAISQINLRKQMGFEDAFDFEQELEYVLEILSKVRP